MPVSGKELVREFQLNGWTVDRIKGSHYILIKDRQTVSIPVHCSTQLGIGLEKKLRKILGKQE